MKRLKIAISQNVDQISSRAEMREGLDVRLSALMWDLGFNPLPLSSSINDKLGYLNELNPDGPRDIKISGTEISKFSSYIDSQDLKT